MKFYCLHCNKVEVFAEEEPEQWYMRRYVASGEYRHKCASCGAAMAPESFLMKDGIITINDAVMYAFSECINAGYCADYDQYGPDCENGHLKPKCLHLLYKEAQDAERRLQGLEKLILQGQGKLIPLHPG